MSLGWVIGHYDIDVQITLHNVCTLCGHAFGTRRGLPGRPPSNSCIRLSDGHFINGYHLHLGATGTNPNVRNTTCFCGCHIQDSDMDHAMTCIGLEVDLLESTPPVEERSQPHPHPSVLMRRYEAQVLFH
jgi:hypothetical protein